MCILQCSRGLKLSTQKGEQQVEQGQGKLYALVIPAKLRTPVRKSTPAS